MYSVEQREQKLSPYRADGIRLGTQGSGPGQNRKHTGTKMKLKNRHTTTPVYLGTQEPSEDNYHSRKWTHGKRDQRKKRPKSQKSKRPKV